MEQEIDLDEFIKLPCINKHVAKTTGASTIEALIGAVWLDSGRDFAEVHRVVHNLRIGAVQQCGDSVVNLSLQSLTIS